MSESVAEAVASVVNCLVQIVSIGVVIEENQELLEELDVRKICG